MKIERDQGTPSEKTLVDKYIDLEIKLASCFQHHRLVSFKPRILALALISLEFEKEQERGAEMNIDWLDAISYLQQLAKVDQHTRTHRSNIPRELRLSRSKVMPCSPVESSSFVCYHRTKSFDWNYLI